MKKVSTYKPLSELKDSNFGSEHIDQYCLCIQVGYDFLEIMVLDSEDKGILYESYRLDNITNNADLIRLLKDIFENHHCLQAGFWKKVYVGVFNKQYSLVPNLFADENIAQFVAFNASIDASDLLLRQEIMGQEAFFAFAFPKTLAEFFQKYYQNVVFTHQNYGFLSGLCQQPALLHEKYLHLSLQAQHLSFAYFKSGKLHYFNSFQYQSNQDLLYFVLLVYSELHLDRESVSLQLYGNFEVGNPAINQLSQHLKTVELGTKPPTFMATGALSALAAHEAFELSGLYQK